MTPWNISMVVEFDCIGESTCSLRSHNDMRMESFGSTALRNGKSWDCRIASNDNLYTIDSAANSRLLHRSFVVRI
jgi:hypothetical protein